MSTARQSSFSEKRLERACQYVSDLWFPANPALLAKLQTTLKINTEESDIDEVLAEVRGDYALFTFCLKGLLELLKQEGVTPPPETNPIELLRWGGIDRLKQILESNDNSISRHFFDSMNEAQVSRLEEAVVSASAAQVLAKHGNIDPELGFSAALLRQLGHTLIAWNYPGVYQRALIAVKEGNSLDVAITQILGFSPSMLAVTLARKWGLTEELCAILDEQSGIDAQEIERVEVVLGVSQSVAELCRIGEALARANNPEQYPSASQDWKLAQKKIIEKVGPDGLDVIRDVIAENCENYTMTVPDFFKGGILLDPEMQLAAHDRQTLFSRNPFIERCLPHVKKRLIELYEVILQGRSTEHTTRLLTKEIIPGSGFTGGCVYTIEPGSKMLIPQLSLGHIHLREKTAIQYGASAGDDPVSLAYQSDEPVVIGNLTHKESSLALIAGVFGYSQRVGVLYLEIPQVAYQSAEKHHLIHFKAFAASLSDCLKLVV